MATPVNIFAIGNSAGIILPKQILARLSIQKGDSVYIKPPRHSPASFRPGVCTPDGSRVRDQQDSEPR